VRDETEDGGIGPGEGWPRKPRSYCAADKVERRDGKGCIGGTGKVASEPCQGARSCFPLRVCAGACNVKGARSSSLGSTPRMLINHQPALTTVTVDSPDVQPATGVGRRSLSCVCARLCICACVRACVRACVCACVRAYASKNGIVSMQYCTKVNVHRSDTSCSRPRARVAWR